MSDHQPNFFVFRINYGDKYKDIRKELLSFGNLRQGWGARGMSVESGVSFESFNDAWDEKWPGEDSNDYRAKRYRNLQILNEIKEGDIIIVPKLSQSHLEEDAYPCKSFAVVKCKSAYKFADNDDSLLQDPKINDFGHIVKVEVLFTCAYDHNIDSQAVKSKFIAYQSPLNRVRSDVFKQAVLKLIKEHEDKPDSMEKVSHDYLSMINERTKADRSTYIKNVIEAMNNLGNTEFENLIGEVFEKNGYKLVDKHSYTKDGGDVDLIFQAFPDNSLVQSITSFNENKSPLIWVQAKKKPKSDPNDVQGVDQLIKSFEKNKNSSNADQDYVSLKILIHLTTDFQNATVNKATEEEIMLVNGPQFASLVIRYGLDADLIG